MGIKLGDAIVFMKGDDTQLKKDFAAGEQKTKGWASSVSTMAGTLMSSVITGGATLALGAVKQLGSEIIGMVGDAIALEGTTNTFAALTESIGTDAVTALGDLRKATRGMVADADLMAAGNKFLAMGLADTSEGAAEMAEVATQLGMAMGEDATGSMENFALMMANQSIPRLDSFGISSSAVRDRIAELQEETEGMTREAAFNQAVMEQAAITMEKVGEQGGGAAGSMARIKTIFANLKTEIGRYFLPVAEKVLRWVGDKLPVAIEWLRGAWEKMQVKFAAFKAIYNEFIKPPLEMLQEAFGRLMEALGINEESMGALGETFAKVFKWFTESAFEVWLGVIIGLINGLVTAVEVVIGVIDLFKQGWEAVQNIKLPKWLTPGSPTPLELALRGIADAGPEAQEALEKYLAAAEGGPGHPGDALNDWLTHLPEQARYAALQMGLALSGENVNAVIRDRLEKEKARAFDEAETTDQVSAWAKSLGESLAELSGTMIEDKINSIAQAANGLWTPLQMVVDAIRELLQSLIDLQGVQLPPWLTPGSPTPFELGLRGITDAITDLPSLQAAFGGMGQANADNRRSFTNYGGIQMFPQGGAGNPLEQLWEMGTV